MWLYLVSFSLAYTGRFCGEDFDGCSEVSCYEGVTCTDNLAPQTGATCGTCPTGLEGDGNKCVGESQAAINTEVVTSYKILSLSLHYFHKILMSVLMVKTTANKCVSILRDHSCVSVE